MRFDTLEKWLVWQESCHSSEIELGLERVGQVASIMGLTLDDSKVVTVAGTNGKGSTVAVLNALLRSAGYSVACFTSPHFLRYNERIRLDDDKVSDQLLIESFDRIDQARGNVPLTFFEFGTLAAIDICQRHSADVILLEVGLGGRLDAVNIIDADIAVITSIDIDHQDWLGSDREQIGREKAGVMRSGKPAISAGLKPPASLQEEADQIGAPLYQAGRDFFHQHAGEGDFWSWCGRSIDDLVVELPELHFPSLPGESVSAALQALQLLGLPIDNVDYSCLAGVDLTGRFQGVVLDNKQLILDVAHNPAAASYLAIRLQESYRCGRTIALVAVMADKDINGIVEPLKNSFDAWYTVELENAPRALGATALAGKISAVTEAEVIVGGSMTLACTDALAAMKKEDRLVVFGSFFTVAELLKFGKGKFKNET
ncbi:MAG: bifunctional tetrahydrofolate synthase/dihydrofolate synthase [Oceanicoccus sp.]